MGKFGGILIFIVGCIFATITLNLIFRGLILLSDKEKDITGVGFAVSYVIPGVIVATTSFLLIRYGTRIIKKRGKE